MNIMVHNRRIEQFLYRIQEAAAPQDVPSTLDKTLWLELHPQMALESATDLQEGEYRIAHLLILYPDTLVEGHGRVYEQLSRSIEALMQNSNLQTLFVLALTASLEDTLQTIVSLLRKELAELERQKPPEPERQEPSMYLVTRGIIQVWDTERFREECLAEAAEMVFRWQMEKEKQQLDDFHLTEELGLQDVSGETLAEVYQRTLETMHRALETKEYRLERRPMLRAFGLGKNEAPPLLAELNPHTSLQGEMQLPPLFEPPVHPRQTLVEIATRLRELIPTFYVPQLPFLDNLKIFQFEGEVSDQLFVTQLWEEDMVYALNGQINRLIQQNVEDLDRLRELTRAHRRERRQEITRILQTISQGLRTLREEEINDLVRNPDLLELSPWRAANAYTEVYQTLFTSLCRLFPQLWGWRTFLGIPLPPRFPSLLYRYSSIIRAARRLLAEILALLNFYATLFQAMNALRQLHNRFHEEFRGIQNLQGYRIHTHNILKELEIYVQQRRKLPEDFLDQITDLQQLRELPLEFPRSEAIPENLLHKLKSMPEAEPLPLIWEIDLLIEQSRKEQQVPDHLYRPLVPFYFHQSEAWRMPSELVKALRHDGEIQKLIREELEKLGIDNDEDMPSGNEYFCSHPILHPVKDFFDEDFFRAWKKRALQDTTSPLVADMLNRSLPPTRAAVEFLIQEGVRQEFWLSMGNYIGLNVQVFCWMPEEHRSKYYQRRSGLTRQDISELLKQSHSREALLDWLAKIVETLDLNAERYQLQSKEQRWEDRSPEFFNILVDITGERQNLPEFVHYGKPEFDGVSRFYLRDTLEESFWPAFAPRSAEDAEPRFFPMDSLRQSLFDSEEETTMISKLFLDFCLSQEREVHVPFDRKISPAHQAAGV